PWPAGDNARQRAATSRRQPSRREGSARSRGYRRAPEPRSASRARRWRSAAARRKSGSDPDFSDLDSAPGGVAVDRQRLLGERRAEPADDRLELLVKRLVVAVEPLQALACALGVARELRQIHGHEAAALEHHAAADH